MKLILIVPRDRDSVKPAPRSDDVKPEPKKDFKRPDRRLPRQYAKANQAKAELDDDSSLDSNEQAMITAFLRPN